MNLLFIVVVIIIILFFYDFWIQILQEKMRRKFML